MDSDVSCSDGPICWMPFIRKRYFSKKNNVYNVESGKIVSGKDTELKNDINAYVKYDKYRSSVENVNLATSSVHNVKYSARANHHKLRSNLDKNQTKNTASPEFINRLEENSKKIENIFSKCKTTPTNEEKRYNIKIAFRTFLEGDELGVVREALANEETKRKAQNAEPVQSPASFSQPLTKYEEYKNIKSALKTMFMGTNFENAIDNLDERHLRELQKKEEERRDDVKLQNMVVNMLKTKPDKGNSSARERTTTSISRKRNHFLENVSLAEISDSSVDGCSNASVNWRNEDDVTTAEVDLAKVDNAMCEDTTLPKQQRRKKRLKRRKIHGHKELKRSSSESEGHTSSTEFSENRDSFTSEFRNCRVNTESSSYGSKIASLDHLDAILLQMRDVSERRKELEKEQTETLASLREKQNELQWRSNCSASEKVKICETIEALQSKIRELEKKMELQNVHHEELLLEMAAIKRCSQQRSSLPGNYNSSSWKKPAASNQEVQTSPESNASELTYLDRLTPSTSNSYDSGNVYESRHGPFRGRQHAHGCLTSIAPSSSFVDLHLASLDPSARYTNNAVACKPYWSQSEPPCTCPVSSDQELPSATPSNESACSDDSGIQNVSIPHNSSSITVDIDKIMAKIDQDNRILAELDKTRSTIATQGSMTAEQLRNISEMGIIPPASCQSMLPLMQQTALPVSASQTAINPGISLSTTFPSYLTQYEMSNNLRPSMGSLFPLQLQQPLSQIPTSQSTFSVLQSGYQGNLSQLTTNLLQSQFDLATRSIKNGNISGSGFASSSDLLLPHEDLILDSSSRRSQDMVEIPGKGLCNIFIAKYSYDPFSQSTNVCPEAELAINAGDYLLVYGEPDDDGYVEAELMDGRRGLVPIIFIQKLSGDELLEFNQRVLAGMRECDDSASTTIPQDIENLNSDEHGKKFRTEYIIGGITEEEEEDADESESDMFFSVLVPAPKQLTLERQLNKSILIRWNAPEDSPSHCIDSYHVYVDGVLKTTIKANERTKALLEGVDSNKPHRISVRSVTQNRRTSRDAACTMLIGKDVPAYPINVKAHHVTATSAVISWMPSNSNYQHTVCVNNVEVRTVKPGVYRHTITGLVPNTLYRVTVRAKNIRAPQFDDKNASDKFASHIDFRTLPKGMPDPPSEIQVELGPQDGTLLVTWIPVSAENANGAPVTGYAVYADGKKVTDIDSPTGDHALIDISKIISMNPRHVTVRTKSKENQSCDSNATAIPASAIKARHHSSKTGNYNYQARNDYGQIIIDPEENLSDKEVYPGQATTAPAIVSKENVQDDNFSEEEFLESHRTNRNLRYNAGPSRSHAAPRSHIDRGRPSPSNTGHDRIVQRPNFDHRGFDVRRENRDYHHSPPRSIDRRRMDPHLMKPTRGPTQSTSGTVRPHASQSNVTPDEKQKLAVALFDYDPASMSPNPSTSHEELAFLVGDQIKILSDKDPDGFYWGECHGKRGYVPQNMITDLEHAPKTILDNMKKRNRFGEIRHSADAKKMVALYNYDPHENSPNPDSDVEISFNEGQIIYVKGEPDDDGFYLGEVDGVQGLVPSNFLQEVEEIPDEEGPSHTGPINRGMVRALPSRDRNRGHGPGARGPPPPPRDGMPPRGDIRDRRKDSRLPYESQQDQLRTQGRIEEVRHPERRLGRELPNVKTDHYGNITRENNTAAVTSNMQNPDPNRNSFRSNRARGAPNVLPELSATAKPTTAPSNSGIGLKFPESPNIMQKLSEITGSSENPVDNILSKGKELIFMKFGLGK